MFEIDKRGETSGMKNNTMEENLEINPTCTIKIPLVEGVLCATIKTMMKVNV